MKKEILLILIIDLIFSLRLAFAADYNISTNNGQTITDCIGTIYDSGGSTGNYGNSEDNKITFCSPNGQCFKIHFASFKLETNHDYIYIYDGPDISSPLRASFTGLIPPADLYSEGSCITIRFVSDASVNNTGFSIQLTCSSTCYIPPTPPSNDNPCSAISLSSSSGTCNPSEYTTMGATTSSVPNPICSSSQLINDVWFQVIIPSSGRLTVELSAGEITNGGLALYKGSDCNSLSIITCSENDIDMPSPQTILSNYGLANQTIWVRYWNIDVNQGTFNICAYEPPPFLMVDTTHYSPQQLIENVLVTGCLDAQNVENDAASSAIGYFNGDGTILGFNSGIIMSTGNVMNASGDGSAMDPGYYTNHQSIANDLLTLAQQNAGTPSVYDVAILEFDFTPSSDTTTFRYIFASNEYPTYNCSIYNDVFAFFVSGPGISGPFSNNAINVALIPGTNLPVCISNIHDGTGGDPWSNCPASYSQYYINNDPDYVNTTDAFLYRGFTVPLTATMILQSCQTYHIVLAIADGGDGALDSGVFLEAGSFSSGEQVLMDHYNYNLNHSNSTYEGCENFIVFSRADTTNLSQPLPVILNISGTASVATDVNPGAFPSNYIIPAGQIHDTLYYTAILDNITEGTETLIFTLGNGCPCLTEFFTDTIFIHNRDSLVGGITEDEITIAQGECATMHSFCNLPNSIVGYQWTTGSSATAVTECPTQTTTYYLTIADDCHQQVIDSCIVYVIPPIYPDFEVNDICFGENAFIVYTGTTGDSITYAWNFDGGTIISGTEQGPYTIFWNSLGEKEVTVTISNGMFSQSHTETVNVKPIPTTPFITDTILCAGQHLNITYTGNAHDTAQFNWNFGSATILSGTGIGPYEITWYTPGNYTITLASVTENGCTSEYPSSISLYVPGSVTINNIITSMTSCFGMCDGIAELLINGGVAPYEYHWSDNNAITDTASIGELCSGTHYITVFDANSCAITDSFIIDQPDEISYLKDIDHVTCFDYHNGFVTLLASNGVPPYSYEWSNGFYDSHIDSIKAGNYFFTITDANGCSTSGVATVTQPPKLVVLGEDVTVCIGQQATIELSGFGGTVPYTYHWYIPSEGTNFIGSEYSFFPEHNTTLIVHLTDINNCISATKPIHVNLYPGLTMDVNQDKTTICPGDSITISFSVEGGNGGPYICKLNDGSIVSPPFKIIPEGNDTTIYYTLTANDYCTTPAVSAEFSVRLLKSPPNKFFSDTIIGCQPLTVNFVESSPNEGQLYYWDFNDPNNNGYSFKKNPQHIFEEAGVYDITLSVTGLNGCKNVVTNEEMITVFEKPNARFTTDPSSISIIDPYVYFENISSTLYQALWEFGDSTHSNDISPFHKYIETGAYLVKLVAVTENSCKDTAYETVVVKDEFTFYAPTAFTPDMDGVNDVFYVVGNGIDPNAFQLFIYDRWGGLIFQHNGYNNVAPAESGWDGTVNGFNTIAPNGVYAWLVIYKNLYGIEHQVAGSVTLIR